MEEKQRYREEEKKRKVGRNKKFVELRTWPVSGRMRNSESNSMCLEQMNW